MGRQRNEARFLQRGLQSDHLYCTVWNAYRAPHVCGLQISPSSPASCHSKLSLHPNCSGCVRQWIFPKKEESYSSLCSPRRAECSAVPALALPNPGRALMSQPYCGLVVLWLQFAEQDGSTRQDKNKVKCSQGYTADLGKLLQLKLICCFTPLCHLCIKVPLGYRTML